jgi:Ca2+-binding EF-hand superfamily protein
MGGAQSAHAHHHHHKAISSRIKKTYAEDGVIVLSDEELKHLWSHYDDNKNNLLDLHELHLLVADLVEHTIEDPAERDTVKSKINENGDFVDALFKQLDLNGDGVVEFHEFTKAYHKVLEHYLANH